MTKRLSLLLAACPIIPACVDEHAVSIAGEGAPFSEGTPAKKTPEVEKPAVAIQKTVEHGRLEDHDGLRVIRLWGTPKQRGRAHGLLAGAEAVGLMRRELTTRFGHQKSRLTQARTLLPLMVAFPRHYHVELASMWKAVKEQQLDMALPDFDRDLDLKDALLLNAMDLVAQMGCSGFTVSGEQVEGGGVLTARNFDWPITGTYLIESCCLIVQHPKDGAAFASIAWPGYVGAITGVNEHGVATFLHFGDSGGGTPRPGAYPTATAARGILRQANAESAFEVSEAILKRTCPPRGYLTRVVTPDQSKGHPARVFEVDVEGVTHREDGEYCIVTNHFLSRGESPTIGDSVNRWKQIRSMLKGDLSTADQKVSVGEAWEALAAVERSGQSFATLHSMVFRHDPWVFEIAIGKLDESSRVDGAPSAGTRHRLTRDAVFASIE
jgi:hypothetical protein